LCIHQNEEVKDFNNVSKYLARRSSSIQSTKDSPQNGSLESIIKESISRYSLAKATLIQTYSSKASLFGEESFFEKGPQNVMNCSVPVCFQIALIK